MGEKKAKPEYIKRRVYEIIEASHDGDQTSKAYDLMMLVAVIVGLIPLSLKMENPYTRSIDATTALIFLLDYILRIWTADYKMGVKSYKSYLAYIVSPLAIIDLLSVVPIMCLIFPSSNAFALFRMFRLLRAFRLLKLIRYSKTIIVLENMFRKVKDQIVAVLMLVLIYIIACALIMFQIEPGLFETFWDAIYWAAISITTVGYGDLVPTTHMGQFVSVVSSLVGVAIIALPTGIITAAYMDEVKRKKSKHEL